MDQLLLPQEILESKLTRLYQRRLAVDELIRSLEQYAAYDSSYTDILLGLTAEPAGVARPR